MKYISIILIFAALLSISSRSYGQLNITANAINAEVHSNGTSKYLDRPSVLKLTNYFVWGGTVVKGKAGKFQRAQEPLLSPRTRVKASNVLNPSESTIAKPDNLIVVNPSVRLPNTNLNQFPNILRTTGNHNSLIRH